MIDAMRRLLAKAGEMAGELFKARKSAGVTRGISTMSLKFPNRNRTYDEANGRVRFLGHDGMFEVPFFISISAFPKETSEAGYLTSFDAMSDSIHKAAAHAYTSSKRPFYVLQPEDFK